ncbi:uncharacterized protein VDAG_03593 [Verticillium dahliae VdLs.17]|uniref:DUF8004 domain-containing protein n=1 Tax=Verticillium dahliae (strain VdLs.17 / ATCC MYA-4575 / FGSC 10137) TaxID=498257 RepID=G2X1I2_VERDV|nr:uncharacterized protein VDAG_03593 [Verticillium dahliae VdLs.17]EGY22155.1 hypothetical protein VDAG_03593 [Verticillium dahliae VdLs.17]
MDPPPEYRFSLPPYCMANKTYRTTRTGDAMDERLPRSSNVKRWDGAARACADWDSLRRDPELWFRGGNCFVHLYGKGQSRRGPAFKVPFGGLLSAKCHPLIQRFISREMPESPGSLFDPYDDLDQWHYLNPTRKVDLYIPAPPMANKQDAFLYHLATRNLIAWVFNRSVVGDHLGTALINLLSSMSEFRNDDEDHVGDLLDYLDEEGYLDIRNQPIHALALLRMAETFQIRDIFTDAFCHCVGMSDRLPSTPEWQLVSSPTRRSIRRAKADMDARLNKASSMLRTFLEDELSETHLGLPAGGRAHMERFRSFLLSFYSTKLGYYPPTPADGRSSAFEPEIYRIMCDDFEALYELLVNDNFTSAGSIPLLAQGGICAVQSVHAFDARYDFKSLDHPLPLLPEVPTTPTSRRIPWLSRSDKLKPDNRLVLHAAQVKASNLGKVDMMRNDLVRAYRKFEEQSVAPLTKVDRNEKISLVDVRKVRWILVYAIYQVLRNCTDVPEEVNDIDADYNLAVSTDYLPSWNEEDGVLGYRSNSTSATSSSAVSMCSPSAMATPTEFKIEPDIDYFTIHRDEEKKENRRSMISRVKSTPPRALSIGKSISRNSTLRRSMSIFKGFHGPAEPTDPTPRKSSYHEIVVHGYGNGTNSVNMNAMVKTPSPILMIPQGSTAARALSTSSKSSVESTADSNGGSIDTAASSAPPTSPKTALATTASASNEESSPPILSPIPIRDRRREVLSLMIPTVPAIPIPPRRRPVSVAPETFGSNYAVDYEALVEEERERAALSPAPLRIRKSLLGPFSASASHLPRDANAWQPYVGDDSAASTSDVRPMWEQFNDFGVSGRQGPFP